MNERDIFLEALEKPTSAERVAFLDTACGDDRALRTRLEALLQSHHSAGEFLGKSPIERVAEKMASVEEGGETEGAPAPPPVEEPLDFLTPSQMAGSLGRIGHYEVQEVIGRGGMGIVLRALDERLHRVVAIKVMAPRLATSAAARKRFSKEAQAAAAICHDHIVTIHAVDEANGLPYLVMQYVPGVSLQERITRSGSLQLQEILRIGMQTASGLAAAHAQGLIHRDVKPANILLENGVERVKITDFGLARAAADSSTSQSGIIAGTPQYMSPEQARGEAIDHRADLFSLGSVLYAMCTGRSPFRGANSIAVLKRVCEEAPTPIRESNPEIPEWLTAIVEKLHAKDPVKRYQTAAEVAEVLGRHLAEVQHPSLAALAVPKGPARTSHSKRWAVAAAILLLLLAGFGMAEGTGVTQLTSTVIRLLTPDGMLVVEVSDPGVKVTIDGDGGLVITGVGQHKVRLKLGRHTLQADKNGQPIPLDQELVTITRDDKPVVRVRLESAAASAVAAPKGEAGAFVLLGGQGVKERKFNTLAEAVASSTDGDTIEVRGNGPFDTSPIDIANQSLTIRAADGFRPVIKLSPEGAQTYDPMLRSGGLLTIEGLEFQRLGQKKREGMVYQPTIFWSEGTLHAANCRFWLDNQPWQACVYANGPVCIARNCEFLAPGSYAVSGCFPSGRLRVMDNCVQVGDYPQGLVYYQPTDDLEMRLTHNTLVSASTYATLHFVLGMAPAAKNSGIIRLEATANIFDARTALGFSQPEEYLAKNKLLDPNETESLARRLFAWRDRRNVYSTGGASVQWSHHSPHGPQNLDEWKKFWGAPDADASEGKVRYQGGNLVAKLTTAPDRITPADFRLRPDSAGYRAGKDGKDLGADVDLVGPGAAYERWKKTPEYQEWLKDTMEVTHASAGTPETAARELTKWQGEWENELGDKLTIKGDQWSWWCWSAANAKSEPLTMNPLKIVEVTDKMTHVLLLSKGIDGTVHTCQAILHLDGDTLHYCGTYKDARPPEFATSPGYRYCAWKRPAKEDKAAAAKELEKLQGKWSRVSLEADGKQLKGEDPDYIFTFKGKNWSIHVGGQLLQAGTVERIDVKEKHAVLYFLDTKAGTWGVSIFVIEGDTLKYLNSQDNRVTEFTTAPGDGRGYGIFRRVKP